VGRGWTGRRTTIPIAVALLALMPGCSIAFVHGPGTSRDTLGGREPDCTTSVAAPVVDTLLAGLQVARFRYLGALSVEDRQQSHLSAGDFEALAIAAAAATGLSAIYGYRVTYVCRQLDAPAQSNRYGRPLPPPATRRERAAEEEAEEAAVQARQRERAAAAAKAASDAAGAAGPPADPPANAP